MDSIVTELVELPDQNGPLLDRDRRPVDFDTVDGKPVSIAVLFLSPAEQTGPRIQAMRPRFRPSFPSRERRNDTER